MIHRAVCYFLTCDSLIYRRKDKRLYWCDLPLLSLWKKCTVLGIWNSRWIMHYALHALGPSDKFLLSVYWGACISSSRVCCCLLCLWIPPSTKNKVQPSDVLTLQEAPCGDLTTHLFCHLCAICQEYREIRERTDSGTSSAPDVTPPPVQTMDEL
ncbi:hypothetical protein CFC21_035094 [Triticum aestivum]|uniref:PLAC8 motif-containing protein n=3 Tax=Triticum TaxID=4564 RepID=A0A8R7TUP2_TRIUA|nr:hypothetical protein CFC21_035094 [Triticum aestivum]